MSSPTWQASAEPELPPPGAAGWVRAILRGVPLALLVFGGLLVLLLVRALERPLFGQVRPVTPWITVFVCRNALRLLGLRLTMHGIPMKGRGGLVANHSSWLDIFCLNAAGPVYFVSKSSVASWPGIGWLARATGTLFIERTRMQAKAQSGQFETRLGEGHRLLFFPEGTSTDGMQVVTFKSSLFSAFFSEELQEDTAIQPVSVVYHSPAGSSPRFYGWWGDMAFGPHLLHTLAARRQGCVEITWHDPIRVAETSDRKALAAMAETAVRAGHAEMRKNACKPGRAAI